MTSVSSYVHLLCCVWKTFPGESSTTLASHNLSVSFCEIIQALRKRLHSSWSSLLDKITASLYDNLRNVPPQVKRAPWCHLDLNTVALFCSSEEQH